MIALLAAVREESHLIRKSLQDSQHNAVGGIAVTTGELFGNSVCLAHSGIGKAAAAATAITLLSNCQAEALWLFGCGGAYPDSGLSIGDLALANGEIFGDEGVYSENGFSDFSAMRLPMRTSSSKPFFNNWPIDQKMHDWAQPHLAEHAESTETTLCSGPFVTVSTCTGTTSQATVIKARTGGICENMEGAAVALACQQLSVPLLELRGISNLVEDRNTDRWNLPVGMNAAQNAIITLLKAWPDRKS